MKPTDRILVTYKPDGSTMSVMRKQFDPSVHMHYEAPKKAVVEVVEEETVEVVEEEAVDLVELNRLYTEKTGKEATGPWAKNAEWLKGKIEA